MTFLASSYRFLYEKCLPPNGTSTTEREIFAVAPRPKKSRALPLVQLSLLIPILAFLDATEADGDAVLESVGLFRNAIHRGDDFVHVMVIHQFLEAAAEGASDPQLLVKIAEAIDLSAWPPLVSATKNARTIGDFIMLFANASELYVTSAEQFLEVRGRNACVGERRLFKPTITPAQNDAFMTAIWIKVLRHAMGAQWRPDRVRAKVSEPAALPSVFYGIRAIKGDRMGIQIQFPSSWLTAPFARDEFWSHAERELHTSKPSSSIVSAVRQVLKLHIGNGKRLTTERAAKVCRMKQRKLARQLAEANSTLAEIIDKLYQEAATEALTHSARPIIQIALSLGYSDSTAFSRAFKRWTGQTPAAFRKHQSRLDDM